MEELYTTWKAIGVAGGDLSFFQDFFVKFYQAFIEGDRWLQYLNGVKTTLLVTALALILGALFLLNYRQNILPRTHVYRKIIPLTSLLLIIAPSVGALSEEIFPEAFPIRTFIDTHDYMQRSALYAENHDEKYNALQAVQLQGLRLGGEPLLPAGRRRCRARKQEKHGQKCKYDSSHWFA